jgi:hypothetical protein
MEYSREAKRALNFAASFALFARKHVHRGGLDGTRR